MCLLQIWHIWTLYDKMEGSIWPSNCTTEYLPKRNESLSTQKLIKKMFIAIEVEINQMSINRLMGKQSVVYPPRWNITQPFKGGRHWHKLQHGRTLTVLCCVKEAAAKVHISCNSTYVKRQEQANLSKQNLDQLVVARVW